MKKEQHVGITGVEEDIIKAGGLNSAVA